MALQAKIDEAKAIRETLLKAFSEAGTERDWSRVKVLGETLTTDEAKVAEFRRRNERLDTLAKEIEADTALEKDRQRLELLGEKFGELDRKGVILHPLGGDDTKGDRAAKAAALKSLGDLFVESRAFKGYSRGEQRSPAVELDFDAGEFQGKGYDIKALLDRTGYEPESLRTGLILPGALRRPVVGDLIPQGTTRYGSIKYMEETTTTNAAAAVAEGGEKPESTLAFTARTSAVEKIATVLPVTDELMDDEPAMRSYVEGRLRQFLALTEETYLISGTGTTPQIRGMLNVVGISTQAKGTDPIPDAIYKAMTLVRTLSFLEPSGVIFHPNNWQTVRLLRTSDGVYIWGSPSEAGPERIWGVPVIATPAMTENTAIVGAFDTAMMIFRKNGVLFAVSDQHSDFFIHNKLMLRVEERLAFTVFRPKGIARVTGLNT